MVLDLMVFVVFPFAMAVAAVSDMVTMTISNRVQLVLVAGFVVAAVAAGMDPTTLAWHLGAGALVLVVAFACFAFGWIGGGDAKLAAATALWFGFGPELMQYLVWASLFGGALTLGLLWVRTQPLPALLAGQGWVLRLHHEKTGIPYGIALATAALTVFPQTFWLTAAFGN